MVTPSGVVGTVTMDAVDGAVVLAITPGAETVVVGTEGAVVVSVTLDDVEVDGVDVIADVELGGVVVADTVVDVEVDVGTDVDVELVDVELEALVDVEPLVSVVDVDDVSDVVVDDVVSDVVVTGVVEVVELVVLVMGAIAGGDNMMRGVSVTISGGTVACGFLASILTSACCTRLASSAFCWASPTSLTRAAATPSCCCAPSQSPWDISFSTCASSVCAESTTGSVRTVGPVPNNEVRSPYKASPGCDWYTAAPNPPNSNVTAAAEPTVVASRRERPPRSRSALRACPSVGFAGIGSRPTSSRQAANIIATAYSSESDVATGRSAAMASIIRLVRRSAARSSGPSFSCQPCGPGNHPRPSATAITRPSHLCLEFLQCPMLRHPDRARTAADRVGGLLRRQADNHTQDEDFALLLGQHLQ